MLLSPICAMAQTGYKTYPQQMERLDRGIVALPAQDQGIFVSWRLFGTDAKGTTFDLQRDGKTIAKGLKVTNFTDKKGTLESRYSVVPASNGNNISHSSFPISHSSFPIPHSSFPIPHSSKEVTPWPDLYRSIPVERPEEGKTPDGRPYQYRPNDCSVGDVDRTIEVGPGGDLF